MPASDSGTPVVNAVVAGLLAAKAYTCAEAGKPQSRLEGDRERQISACERMALPAERRRGSATGDSLRLTGLHGACRSEVVAAKNRIIPKASAVA